MSKETGGPAFPVTPTDRSGQIADTEIGMTLRDYFAAKAVAALITEPMWNEMQVAMVLKIGRKPLAGAELYASAAYALADAMLESRK